MSHPMKLALAGAALCLSMLGGCATGHIDPADRDTSGAYDGTWIGEVGGPRARRVDLPGNWYTTCDWEPYELYLTVDDGRVRLGRLEGRTPVSTDGDFRIDVNSGPSGMQGGVMPGNAENVAVFTGNLAGSDPHGKYALFNGARNAYGCSAPIRFRRATDSDA